ncbi:hypothetical protein V6Z12_A05G181800 [Gossypium hirsutum]
MTSKIVNDIARSLPEDMLSEILKHAASNSAADFVNARLSCKAFRAASNYDQIFQNVSMEKLNFVPWRRSEKVLQKRCEAAQNAEALYRKGMMDCFSLRESEFGLHCLKKAAEKGHQKKNKNRDQLPFKNRKLFEQYVGVRCIDRTHTNQP